MTAASHGPYCTGPPRLPRGGSGAVTVSPLVGPRSYEQDPGILSGPAEGL